MNLVACPVALHPDGAQRRIAVCLHPQHGLRLISTAVAGQDDPTDVAARILYALSALETRAALPIGSTPDITEGDEWHFALCRIVPPVRERWQHLSKADNALLQFTWMPLDDPPIAGFGASDLRALAWLKAAL
jgi:hypothetical protein